MKIKYLCPKNKQTNGTKSLIKYWSLNLHIPRPCTCDAIVFWDKSEAAFLFSTDCKDALQRPFLQKWNFANLSFESCGHSKKKPDAAGLVLTKFCQKVTILKQNYFLGDQRKQL